MAGYSAVKPSTDFFAYVLSLFGPFTVDRFASPDSAKRAKFIPNCCSGAKGVDAFSVDWAGENNWLVPPIYLISRTIFHLEVCGAPGVLVIPKWLSAAFWPNVFPMAGLRPSFLTLLLFLHLLGMVTIQYFVRLDSSLRF